MMYNLLIVDDSRSMRAVIRKVVEMSGFATQEFYEAGSGQEALEVMAERQVDLVLSDINMPEMSGLELLAKIKVNQAWSSVPVVVISTEGSEERQKEAFDLGASGYLQKPFQPEKIKILLDGLLEQ